MSGDRLLTGCVLAFGAWTVLCHGVVALGGNLWHLEGAAVAAAVVWAAVVWHRSRSPSAPPFAVSAGAAPTGDPAPGGLRIGLAVAAVVWVGVYAALGGVTLFWIGALALVAVAAFWELPAWLREPDAPSRAPSEDTEVAGPPSERSRAWLVAGLCAAGSLVTLFLHRPDADDAYYLNLAVAAADHPAWPLLARDTLHGVADAPLSLPVYKVHSLELLLAALAHLTPLRVLDVAHVLLPLAAGALVPLAYARLLRRLAPDRWPWALVLGLLFLLCVGAPHQTYGNFAFVRLHQGKAILLTLMVPVLIAFALEYAARPRRSAWWLLAAAQAAAVGLSATGLWLAPVVVGLAVVAGARAHALGAAAAGIASSAYVVGVGLWLSFGMRGAFAASDHDWSDHADATFALESVLGRGGGELGLLAAMLCAWSAASTPAMRRVALLFVGGFLLLFWNPWLASWVGLFVTGEPTYWRVYWMLPLPLLVAVVLSWPRVGLRPVSLGAAASAILALGLLGLAPRAATWSEENGVHVGAPGWKLPPDAGGAAQRVVALAPPGSAVLTPTAVARWVPVQHDHPHPLVVREIYLTALRDQLSVEEMERRTTLAQIVSGRRPPGDGAVLADALERYPLHVVCLAPRAAQQPVLQRVLRQSPLELMAREDGYEVWARPR